MVKTMLSILITLGLLIGAAFFEQYFVDRQFDKFETALHSLDEKVRDETAVRGDAESVRTLWESEKKVLHVVIPHTDISYVDYWLSEAVSLIETENYTDAQSKIEVLLKSRFSDFRILYDFFAPMVQNHSGISPFTHAFTI